MEKSKTYTKLSWYPLLMNLLERFHPSGQVTSEVGFQLGLHHVSTSECEQQTAQVHVVLRLIIRAFAPDCLEEARPMRLQSAAVGDVIHEPTGTAQ